MFSLIPTTLADCFLLEGPRSVDDRGYFQKVFHSEAFSQLSLCTDFKEQYFTSSGKNVLRGMHVQLPPHQHYKMVWVVKGKITDVMLDLRKKSPTFGECFSVELSEDRPTMVYIAPGIAHGFLSLAKLSVVAYNVSSVYEPTCDVGVRWDSFDGPWRIDKPILSARDAGFPSLSQFVSPF